MIDYEFTAKEHTTNRVVKGTVQADNEAAAAKLLGEKQLFVVALKTKREGFKFDFGFLGRVKEKDKVIFTRQLSTLVKAGLPITQALNTAVEQVENKKFREILDKVKASVEGGTSLADAFGAFSDIFNRTFISLMNAGEQSGTLDKTLERLATQMEKEMSIKSKVRGALIYPAIVLVVIILVVIFMLVTVLPQIKSLYSDLNQTLPILTRILLWVSDFLRNFWWLAILILVGLVAGLRAYIRTPKGRYQLDKFKLDAPPLNGIFKKLYMARFTRTLGVLIVSGVPILEAIHISGDAVTNEVLKRNILDAGTEVKGGKALSGALVKYPYFLSLVPRMIKIGEDSGTLGDMLDKVATFYEDEVDQTVKNLQTFIEPIMMVIMGILVGLIIVAILYPVYGLVGNGLTNFGSANSSASSATSGGTK